ncbi:glycosyltransferase family 2 protein [Mycolicibacterium litorale]|uniref:Glycosyl transferase family A n=1 Tax=Mycolicibacterium litorale TaxID=758802 RepID=A0AAD1IP34_9MYCO|nr:glycosyltransferase family 2 protein [Mycolicibacterium litorale]MCV7417267.1 glycosyltransferase family 2 protein [Mycolicibacterium litorale]TDY05055.1 GT2 family glycosyltransferase [Mycolicibacterium litorale]BBY18486.1 glycosyl transferase family A [Mycolicibacterium litorale]
MTTALVTVAHGRHDHLRRQSAGLERSRVRPDLRVVVAIDDPGMAGVVDGSAEVIDCATTTSGLPLARARNLGAEHALRRGADVVIFLDVDCIPGETLVGRYAEACATYRSAALFSGPVTYLPPPLDAGYPIDALATMTRPHPGRPAPPPGELVAADDHDLFWSLSFAVSASTWRLLGGFCETYAGYGGEDTDFGAVARTRGVPLVWVGGADAYHQHHPVSDPPVEHLDEIVANARIFHRRWNRWPMPGWLDAFERSGLISRRGDDIVVTPA